MSHAEPYEMSRPVPLSRIGTAGLELSVSATAEECAAIARRLMVPSVESVQCTWRLRPSPSAVGPSTSVEADGSLHARLHQACVVTLDPFPADLVEEFAVRFVPAGQESDAADDPDEPDEVPFEAGVLELGEATVEQLALALDPYPRKPGAVLPSPDEAPATSFDGLKKWRRRD